MLNHPIRAQENSLDSSTENIQIQVEQDSIEEVEIEQPTMESVIEAIPEIEEEVVVEYVQSEEEPIIEEVYIDDYTQAVYSAERNDYFTEQQELSDQLYNLMTNIQEKATLNPNGLTFEEMKNGMIQAMIESKNINRTLLGNKITIATYPTSKKYKFMPSEGAVGEVWYYDADHSVEIIYEDANIIQSTTAQFDAAVEEILALCENANTDIDKELIVHDYLVANYEYDAERLNNGTIPPESYSAYGLLVNKTAVCQGYAYAMKHILRKMNIPCEVVTGGDHAWNIVNIDGENYYVDATWDDPVPDVAGRITRKHFNVTAEQLAKSGHIWEESKYPECNSEKYNFLQHSNEYIHHENEWFYTQNGSEYIESLGKYVSNSLYRYNIETGEKKLLVLGSCTQIQYDETNQLLYYIKDGEGQYYDLLEEKMSLVYDFVNGFYKAFLNRPGEVEGIKSWSRGIVTGRYTGAQLAEAFLNTKEFIDRNLTNKAYIEILYVGILERIPDEMEVDYWKSQLEQGLSRTYILSQFINSQEFSGLCEKYQIEKGHITLTHKADLYAHITPFVYRFYKLGLDRIPEQAGLDYWVENLYTGELTGAQMARSFLLSEEFLEKTSDNEVFVETLYKIFFDRASDLAGKEYWMTTIEQGESKSNIIEAFINSREYEEICLKFGIKRM